MIRLSGFLPDLNALEIGGQTWKLRPRTMDLLIYMAEQPDRVLTMDDLLSGVWRGVVVSEGSVYQAISELRSTFERAGAECPIETIPKRGYRLTTNAGIGQPATPMRRASLGHRLAVGTAAVALGALGGGLLVLQELGTDERPSVAVLPFGDRSANGNKAYLADGVSEAVYHYLARIDGLRVAGWPSSNHFKGGDTGIAAVAEQLGVRYVLDGSLGVDGDALRVTARLADAENGATVWSRRYDEELGDIFELEEGIAEAVADAIGISLGVGRWDRIPGMTRNLEAYDAYLRGQGVSPTDLLEGGQRLRAAIDHLNRAVAIDPDFGLAWFSLALMHKAGALGASSEDPSTAWDERARYAARRAQELMPDSPQVLAYFGLDRTAEGRWSEAGDYYDRARLAAATDASGRIGKTDNAEFLISVGRIEQAIAALQRALTDNPLDQDVASLLALAYASANDPERAALEADRSRTLEPTLPASAKTSARFLVALSSRDRSVISSWIETPPESAARMDPMNLNRVGLAYLDEPEKGLKAIRRLARDLRPPQNTIPLATWANYYGDPELAVEAFRRAPVGWQTVVVFHLWLPIYAEMRRLPGFKDLVTDLGLVEHWRESGDWGDFCAPVGADDFECQ